MTGFYHVCFAVPDIQAAMRDLRLASGVEWSPPKSDRIAGWDFQIAFTTGGPPFIELIEAPAGSPWDSAAGARFDHLGFWSTSVLAGSRRLDAAGLPEDFSGCPYGRPFVYHQVDSIGARVELVDTDRQPAFLSTWHPGGAPMPAIEEPHEE
ncbi:catechol 2,3-dioxygenase-like lactoylglutathione lyase family enzyme [Lipingzhangella halophila]|uniref:Catechol 2,3-dioxygenase-like lactoylglutathione lyase family enzyme n=1 Tax=Lipingzhangella halophila TaxID=1783352 RepID=A0A7W7W1A7_9ACTN|nr:VOC family protein [Lipingzhangella halophila]MBB4929564.1 catechol 2,3-dioxygenase-like lactoylglutathione lyase family enzyme [Lipingzhangella halophila]